PREGRQTANREMSTSIYGEKNARACPWLPGARKNHDPAGTARQCFDFWSWSGPGRAPNEFALKRHVPEQQRRKRRCNRWPPRESQPIRQAYRPRPPLLAYLRLSSVRTDRLPRLGWWWHWRQADRECANHTAVLPEPCLAERTVQNVRLDSYVLLTLE